MADQIQKEIAAALQRDFRDPRVGFATVSGVDVSGDLTYAKVYVTFLGIEDSAIKDAVKILNSSAGFFRSVIGKNMKLRVVPEISFYYDETLVHGMEISGLITKTMKRDQELAGGSQNIESTEDTSSKKQD